MSRRLRATGRRDARRHRPGRAPGRPAARPRLRRARDPRPGRAPAGRAGVRRGAGADRRGRRVRLVRQPRHRPPGRRVAAQPPWTGSAAGSTRSPRRAGRCCWSGFSGGAAFAGGLVLDDPARYAGAAILYGTLPFDAGLADRPRAGWPTCPSSWPRATATTSSPASSSTAPGTTCWPSPGAPPSRTASPAATQLTAGDRPPARRLDRPPARPRRPRTAPTPAGPAVDVRWPTLPDGELPAARGPRPEVSWTIPQQQQTQNAPADLQERLLDEHPHAARRGGRSVPHLRARRAGLHPARGLAPTSRRSWCPRSGSSPTCTRRTTARCTWPCPPTLAADVVDQGLGPAPHVGRAPGSPPASCSSTVPATTTSSPRSAASSPPATPTPAA